MNEEYEIFKQIGLEFLAINHNNVITFKIFDYSKFRFIYDYLNKNNVHLNLNLVIIHKDEIKDIVLNIRKIKISLLE